MTRIQARRAPGMAERLADPADTIWAFASPSLLEMAPTPIGFQPSMYVVAAWRDRSYGRLPELAVSALHTGSHLGLKLEWREEQPVREPADLNEFADAAAVLFAPHGPETPVETMGSPSQPVVAWYWRPQLAAPITSSATGSGTMARFPRASVQARGAWSNGTWSLSFVRPLAAEEEPHLQAGSDHTLSFAIWRGANSERAGIKAFAKVWHELYIEA
jgi:DMSO reductase family type II enzyme heme b subunit